MPRRLLFFALALVVSTRSAVADYRDDIRLDACKFVAQEALLRTVATPNSSANIELCNAHEQCLNYKHFIEQHGKAVPSLTCARAATSAPPKPDEFKYIFEIACAMAATGILTGAVSGNLQGQVALCNEHPDKQSCVDTKNFIASRRNGDSGGLTCE